MTASIAPASSLFVVTVQHGSMILRLRVRLTLQRLFDKPRSITMSAFQKAQQAAQESRVHTIEGLKKWSVGDHELPSMIVLYPQ